MNQFQKNYGEFVVNDNGVQNRSGKPKQYISNSEYIEKKIHSLSIYDAYWCLFELRSQHRVPQSYILKDDSGSKLKVISILKGCNYRHKDLDKFLQTSAKNSIPLSYVKWFYEDARAALWLYMVLKKFNIVNNHISLDSDIAIFVHDIVFNKKLAIREGRLCEVEVDDTYYERWIGNKKKSLDVLKNAYLRSSVEPKKTRWLDYRNSIQINHLYEYMQKLHDIDNLKANKENKKYNKNSITNKDKTGYKQALIFADTIRFRETDTASRLHHILASLDYWMLDTYWFDREGIAVDEREDANRSTFLDNMYDVWLSKAKRNRDKKIKAEGLELTGKNKKLLKILARKQGKTQVQMLNDIVASYDQTFFSQIPKSANSISAFTMGNYGETYMPSFETEQSLKAKQTSPETISVNIDISNNKDISHQIKTLEPTPYIAESNDNRSEDRVEDVKQNQSDEQSISLGNSHDDNKIIDEPVLPPHEDTIALVNISTMATDGPTTKLQAAENNLARSAIYEDININQIADHEKDPFKKNAEIMKKQLGGALKK